MKGTVIHQHAASLFCLALLVLPQHVEALVNSRLTLTIIVEEPPTCIINDNRPIEVEFGDIFTTQVDGTHYRKSVDYSLSCDAGAINAMQLQVKGIGAAFDNTVLQTNKDGLGIKLMRGGTPLSINTWLPFIFPNKPELWAVPVKAPGATLTAGEFSAAASMQVNYP